MNAVFFIFQFRASASYPERWEIFDVKESTTSQTQPEFISWSDLEKSSNLIEHTTLIECLEADRKKGAAFCCR
jgi:hypothetical protein